MQLLRILKLRTPPPSGLLAPARDDLRGGTFVEELVLLGPASLVTGAFPLPRAAWLASL